MNERIHRNLRLVPVYQAFSYGYAVIPFLLFLAEDRGLSLAEFASLQSVYYATGLVLEVPTGVFSDRFGRRLALLLAAVSQVAGFVMIATASGFAEFAFAHFLLAAGQAFMSGTTTAILYDSLCALGRESDYLQFESRSILARLGGTSAAFLIGGGVAQWQSIEATAWLSAGFSFCAIPVLAWVAEPPRHADPKEKPAVLSLVIKSIKTILASRELVWACVLFAALFAALRIVFYFYTPSFVRAGIHSYILIGIIYFILNLVAAGSAHATARIGSRASESAVLLTLLTVLSISFAIQGIFTSIWVILACSLLQQIPFGIHFPIVASFVNRRVSSDRRATVLSCFSLAGRAFFAMIFSSIGALAESSFSIAMLVSAAGVAIFVILLYRFRPVR
ncbi:MAG: MFS transporter [Planctomycetota bacterium]